MKLNIDFCIIENPIANNDGNLLIFITRSGLDYLDERTKDEESYYRIVDTLKEVGYLETDELRFEYIKNDEVEQVKESDLIESMESAGAKYSKNLETTLKKDLEKVKDGLDVNLINDFIKQAEVEEFGSSIDEAFFYLQSDIDTEPIGYEKEAVQKFKLPEIGESIDLNMYLMIDLALSEDTQDFTVDFTGSFTKSNKELTEAGVHQNLVKIFKDSFKRVNRQNKNGTLEFESTKTKGEMYEEITFLYDVVIDILRASKLGDNQTMLETEGYFFNILDLKEKVDPTEKIYFELGVEDYSALNMLSESIALEKTKKQDKETIFIDEVRDQCDDFVEDLESSMMAYAEEEEFVKASVVQKSIKTVKEKIEKFLETTKDKKKISINEYHELLNAEF